MPVYKELDPELAWRAIEGFVDELTPAARAQDTFYRQFRCPRGHGDLQREYDSRHAVGGDGVLQRALLRCPVCRYLIEPETRLVLESGNAATLVDEPPVPLLNPE